MLIMKFYLIQNYGPKSTFNNSFSIIYLIIQPLQVYNKKEPRIVFGGANWATIDKEMQSERVTHDRPLGQFLNLQKLPFQSEEKKKKKIGTKVSALTFNLPIWRVKC